MDSAYLTPLAVAVSRGAVDCVTLLLEHERVDTDGARIPGADPAALAMWKRPRTNDTLLHICVKAHAASSEPVSEAASVAIAELLIAAGVPREAKDAFGNTARGIVPPRAKALSEALFDPLKDIRVTFSG